MQWSHFSYLPFHIKWNAIDKLLVYDSMDAENNVSEHLPVKRVMDFNVEYINSRLSRPAVHRATWYKATDEDVAKYKEIVDTNLDKISLPHAALLCNDKFCEVHKIQINEMHDNIISSLLDACNSTIPKSRPAVSKVVAGWNEYIEKKYFQASLFWHDMWKANDQPREGLIADLPCKTRKEYHKVCKLVMKKEGEVRSDILARSILNNCTGTFWR